MSDYSYTKEVNMTFSQAITAIKASLRTEGFGVLTEIDIKAKIKEKLGKDFDDYTVLGACNPTLAYEALQNELKIGLLLPCNVIVYKKNKKVFVSTIVPSVAMSMIQNKNIEMTAVTAEEKLKRAIDNV